MLLPNIRDPRLHLAAVIISLQILGQVAFEFRLSIAQILVSLLTCAVLEMGIAFRRQHVILWPASALLTGNGVAFILRVPGTEHGDWWSMNGWWIFAATAAVSLLSKHLIQFRGGHIFNPSNFGLVLCFLLLGPEHADPLEFWWGPMSLWLALALAIIIGGGFAILRRLRLLHIAITFWVTFVASIAVLAASGHDMTARWHLGPVSDWYFWRVLAFSPEILVFLFFMITDPKTIPAGKVGRRVYAVSIGLLAALLLAPQTTEFGSKVAVLSSLAIVCAARPLLVLLADAARRRGWDGRFAVRGASRAVGAAALAGAVVFVGLLVVAGNPARSSAEAQVLAGVPSGELVEVTVEPAQGIAPIDQRTAERIARDAVADLENESEALRRRDRDARDGGRRRRRGSQRCGGRSTARRGGRSSFRTTRVERVRVSLEPGRGPGAADGRRDAQRDGRAASRTPARPTVAHRGAPARFTRTFELVLEGRPLPDHRVAEARPRRARSSLRRRSDALGGVRLQDVAAQVGLDFTQDAFHFGVTNEPDAMMGGGLCWIDYDADGWLDLYVVNAYADDEYVRWTESGGLPRSALFHNVKGRFVDVSRGSGADLQLRGNGCVAADFNQDGHADLFVTTAGYNVATNGYDALLWGHGDGTFTEGARAAGINDPGWHSGAAVGDVNGDGRPDLFVAGYADINTPIPGSSGGFPSNFAGVRDRLYLNDGPDGTAAPGSARSESAPASRRGASTTASGRSSPTSTRTAGSTSTSRTTSTRTGSTSTSPDPARRSASGSRSARASERVDDPNAGMGIAAADYSLDGRDDLFVTNSRRQLHAVYRSARREAVRRTPGPTSSRRSAPPTRAGACRGSTSTSTATSTSSWRTARSRSCTRSRTPSGSRCSRT